MHATRRGRRLAAVGLILSVLLLAIYGGRRLMVAGIAPACQARALGQQVTIDPEQAYYASVITAITVKRRLPPRAATIALATALQESKLRNIPYGDRDSVGLFQQRPSQGWGTRAQLLDPEYATGAFLEALTKFSDWQNSPITVIAQKVQHSAYPNAYAKHEQAGRLIASSLTGHSPGGFACRLDAASQRTDIPALRRTLTGELGVTSQTSRIAQREVVVVKAASARQAWQIAGWAVAQADTRQLTAIQVGDQRWTRSRDAAGWTWPKAPTAQDDLTVLITPSDAD